jgi:hypothetical protein
VSYRFIYSNPDKERIIPAVLIDKRATITSIANQTGNVIKLFVDTQVALISSDVLLYKIETANGNLVGYFSIKIVREGVAVILQFELRPAYEQYNTIIMTEINNFMSSGSWSADYLN